MKELLEKAIEITNDLYWDYDRMSSSGQEMLDKLGDTLNMMHANLVNERRA